MSANAGRDPDRTFPTVSGASLIQFLGLGEVGELDQARAEQAVEAVRMYVWAYTRGNGFDYDDQPCRALASVVHSGASRLFSNPEQDRQQTVGGVTIAPGVMSGFTLAELAVLNRYRRRAL